MILFGFWLLRDVKWGPNSKFKFFSKWNLPCFDYQLSRLVEYNRPQMTTFLLNADGYKGEYLPANEFGERQSIALLNDTWSISHQTQSFSFNGETLSQTRNLNGVLSIIDNWKMP